MTDYDSIEIVQSPSQSVDLVSSVWKRFKRHRGAITGSIVLGIIVAMCMFAFLSPYDPEKSSVLNRFQPPSPSHLMGTDALGRDLFTRILYGGRISLADGVIAVGISLFFGIPVDAMAGYYGGRTDSVLMR